MTDQEARDERDPIERLIEYVANVVGDRRYGHDVEWVRGNLNPTHLRRLADEFGYRKHPEPEITDAMVRRGALAMYRRDTRLSMAGATTLVRAALEAAGYRKHPEPDADIREKAEWRFPRALNMLPGDEQDTLRMAQVHAYVLGCLDERAKHPAPDIPDASPGCPACGHAIAEHHGRWCRVPTGAVSRRGSALICSCEAVDAAEGER